MLQHPREITLRNVFEQVTGEGEIHAAGRQKVKLGHAANNGFNPGRQEIREMWPAVQRNAPMGNYLVDKSAVAAAQVKHTVIGPHDTTEIEPPQRLPDDVASRINGQTGTWYPELNKRILVSNP